MTKNPQIVQLGHPVLRQQAQKVTDFSAGRLHSVIQNMTQLLSDSNGVGIAAPQIAESFCILIIASKPSQRYPLAPVMEPLVLINPAFEIASNTMTKDWEGCLSIPGIRALVPRYEHINVTYFDPQGNQQLLSANGFIARIFQHEYDHLQGMVYLDRVETNRDIITETEYQKLMEQKIN